MVVICLRDNTHYTYVCFVVVDTGYCKLSENATCPRLGIFNFLPSRRVFPSTSEEVLGFTLGSPASPGRNVFFFFVVVDVGVSAGGYGFLIIFPTTSAAVAITSNFPTDFWNF